MKYIMKENNYYGEVVVPYSIFDKIDNKYLISHSSSSVKYLCANSEETKHIESLGIDTSSVICDWYKICLKTNIRKQCNAPKSAGYWRGYRCANEGKYEHDDKHYCYAHIKKAELGEYDTIDWDKE